jgi:hypothetical protein
MLIPVFQTMLVATSLFAAFSWMMSATTSVPDAVRAQSALYEQAHWNRYGAGFAAAAIFLALLFLVQGQ